MKITKSQLRQIIKEEFEKELKEQELVEQNLLSTAMTLAKQGGLVMLLKQEEGRNIVSDILTQIGDFFSKANIPGLEQEMKTLDAGLTTAANTLNKLTDEQLGAALQQVLDPQNIQQAAFKSHGPPPGGKN